MSKTYVVDLYSGDTINPRELFGRDANRILEACESLFKLTAQYSRETEDQRDKQFRIIYGTARRHGLHIKWHGNVYQYAGTRHIHKFTVYKQNIPIARIFCM